MYVCADAHAYGLNGFHIHGRTKTSKHTGIVMGGGEVPSAVKVSYVFSRRGQRPPCKLVSRPGLDRLNTSNYFQKKKHQSISDSALVTWRLKLHWRLHDPPTR